MRVTLHNRNNHALSAKRVPRNIQGMTTPTDGSRVATHCPYCALQCGMTLSHETDGGVSVAPRGGGLCHKGWTAPELLDHPDRLTAPLLGGRPADWPRALDRVAEAIRETQERYGPDAVAVFGGGGLTNEKAYLLGKFARVALGTSNIDYNGRFCMSSAAAAGNRAFGVDRGLPFPLEDLAQADTVLLVGANPAETMPPMMRHLARPDLVVIDPRLTETAARARLHLRPLPGTDLALANGLLHIAIERGYVDDDFVASRTTGFAAVGRAVAGYWPAFVERITSVSVADQYRAAELLATGNRAILTARGAEQHSKGVDTVSAWINLALALGLPGKPSNGYGCITGQGNGQGGREHGQKADQLPGYRRIDDPVAREHVAKVWGVPPQSLPGPGRPAIELLGSLGRDVKTLLVFGSNPAVSAPNSAVVTERLKGLDHLVVADCVPSETVALAEVVLPVTQWAEEDGTLTDLTGRVIRRRALREPPSGVHSDLWVLRELAKRLDAPSRFPDTPSEVFDELAAASAGGVADYSGIDYARLDAGERLHWPCPAPSRPGSADDARPVPGQRGPAGAAETAGDARPASGQRGPARGHSGTPRMFAGGRFATPDGRARFTAVEHRPAAETADTGYPLLLTTGRVLTQYQSGAQTRRTSLPGRQEIELHPDTARRFGIGPADSVTVTSRRGSFTARAKLTESIRTDTVFASFHWPDRENVNRAVNDVVDPVSGMPEFKVCAVRIASTTSEDN
ncbi:molybdopterin oxidoreductase [Stackebrandtia nassauensis DSM 44728]|uniref:Molybdopterin oxidoreductase n=2 Tax=Stackebrandtia TaxID=283810 RepID=D3Q7C9_STANL|nr:molybdopterin oxidoreductase [Stackebrandtia nassauensis DSM 44728]